MDFAMRSPPRPSRGDSGLSLVSPSHMLTVVLPGGPVDLSDSADTRETVHQLPRESLEDIVLALRDRVAQDSRGEARRPARRRSSLTLGRASFSVSTGSADDILGVSQAERMLEQIRQLQAQLDGATQEVADRDEIIEDLQAQLRDTEPSGESPAARSGKLRGSELELLGTLQERDRMLSEADSTLRGYADALRARDDLVQKTSRWAPRPALMAECLPLSGGASQTCRQYMQPRRADCTRPRLPLRPWSRRAPLRRPRRGRTRTRTC
eukprot:m.128148 g.128148  ORF g.128148 m.128148 type:complete len:267 (+) comp9407_c1_seq1:201-1001(+)